MSSGCTPASISFLKYRERYSLSLGMERTLRMG
jgi:hypothetical protein